jgi:beta-mannosidase
MAGVVFVGLMLVGANNAKGADMTTTADLHVAVSGKDSNPGTAAAPFAMPARALEALCLSGADWRIHDDADGKGDQRGMPLADPAAADWTPATVPGNIQADLEAAHQLKPLWYGAGDPRLYGVAEKDWWYRKDITIPGDFQGRRLTLVFDGVDHECEVWLNGRKLGRNAGMFRRFWFDATEATRPGEVNRLAVRVDRMPKELVADMVNTDGSGVGSPFVGPMNRTRKLLKECKSVTNWAYDWGVNIWTLGIWKDVRLEATGPARIEWTRVQTSLRDDHAQATVKVTLEIDSAADLAAEAELQIAGHGASVRAAVNAPLKKGHNVVVTDLTLERPALWWPNGHGDHPLYVLSAALRPAAGGAASDERRTRFGVRDVRWTGNGDGITNTPGCYHLRLNGRPIRTMGSNLIPPDLLFGRMQTRACALVRRAHDAGMNMFRIWGGGVPWPEEAYDLADEFGIMIETEFPLANCDPENDEVFLGNLDATARNIVRQVRNHPSIIEYSGGNEMAWSPTSLPALNILRNVAHEEDDRLFRDADPCSGGSHGPYYLSLIGRNLGTSYGGTYADLDGPTPARRGEVGTSSLANLEVWQREIPPKSQWPIDVNDPIIIRKNISQAVFDNNYWMHKKYIDLMFGPCEDLAAFVRAGQFCGAEGLRYIVDALRRQGRSLGGFTTWCFNEPWPNGAGSYMIDYDGRPLMNYDFVKQALAPVVLSLKYNSLFYDSAAGVKAELWIASDAPQPAEGLKWRWLARDRRGLVIARDGGETSIGPQEARRLAALDLKPPAKTALGPVFVEMQLHDGAGRLLAERIHVFGAAGANDSLAGLLRNRTPDKDDDAEQADPVELPNGPANLASVGNGARPATATSARPEAVHQLHRVVTRTAIKAITKPLRAKGDTEVLELTLENTGRMTALFCEPHPLIEYRTDLFIENNHCFIPPGEKRTVTIRAAAKPRGGLGLAQTGWRISTWNADDVTIEPSSDVLLAVGRRDAMCREFRGYGNPDGIAEVRSIELSGRRPDPSSLPFIFRPDNVIRLAFPCDTPQAGRPARLRIHTADQSAEVESQVSVSINGMSFQRQLPRGLGIQRQTPAHLAFPAIAEFQVPKDVLKTGTNVLEVRLTNGGWFTWDALDLVADDD